MRVYDVHVCSPDSDMKLNVLAIVLNAVVEGTCMFHARTSGRWEYTSAR
jgi:hypothetical protein